MTFQLAFSSVCQDTQVAEASSKGYPAMPVPISPKYSSKVSLGLGSILMKINPSQVSTETDVIPRASFLRPKKLSSSVTYRSEPSSAYAQPWNLQVKI